MLKTCAERNNILSLQPQANSLQTGTDVQRERIGLAGPYSGRLAKHGEELYS